MKKNAVLLAGALMLGLAGCGQGSAPQSQVQSASDNGQQAAGDAAMSWIGGTAKVRCDSQDNSTPAWKDPSMYHHQRTVRWGKDAWAVVIAEGENDSSPVVLGMINENGRWVLKSRGELNQMAKGSKNSECRAERPERA